METGGLHRKGVFQGTPRSLGAQREGRWGSWGRLAGHVSAAMTSVGPVSLKGPPASSHHLIYLVIAFPTVLRAVRDRALSRPSTKEKKTEAQWETGCPPAT